MLGTILFLSALTQTDGGASFSYGGGGGGGGARQNGIRESSTFPSNYSELYFPYFPAVSSTTWEHRHHRRGGVRSSIISDDGTGIKQVKINAASLRFTQKLKNIFFIFLQIHLAGVFPISGKEGWQGGQVGSEKEKSIEKNTRYNSD